MKLLLSEKSPITIETTLHEIVGDVAKASRDGGCPSH